MHITDILPTLAAAANISITTKIDGVNQWQIMNGDENTKRKSILYNIDPVLGFSAIMSDGWKLINGSENINYSGWFGSSGIYASKSFEKYYETLLNSTASNNLPIVQSLTMKKMREEAMIKCGKDNQTTKCNPIISPCLFDIVNDPCELNNLAEIYQDKVKELIVKLNDEIQEMVSPARRDFDPMCDPKLHNNTWTWWRGEGGGEKEDDIQEDDFINRNTFLIILCSVFIIIQFWMLFIKCRNNAKNFVSLRLL